ncbi:MULTISPECIES: ABC transporter substrate-binding protein [Thalassospira]|uniref:ABC transporter substrate-binding protein n=2 Tax=Thalassospira tepidiphila TaxID=393657 RepID=A0A853KYE3_9PROT|nr:MULTISPECIES: ABC transporter substrate-binding protein [Thalassospira]MBO6578373.1 ABC transporter substrate-binding protein [Thalassospira sp.]MBO6819101.1 ABC transporter substrate-binding protein [Thalassospira sp.]MBO6887365.1 ABC transporter substrate-binding protein [Thalassospira sp.]NJB76937.1 iron(III) transport system substrate-binding protein [Thalassospira tepidiphila]OAZ09145.1 ABC transporter substrate-binding protein [Thalassospira tepidiphila MCCC 1A03514]
MRNVLLAAVASAAMMLPVVGQAAEKLVLYTSQPNKDAQATVDAFMAANPDIEVEWVRDGTTKLLAKLRAEIAAGDPRPDVLLIADTVTLEGLKQEGQLQAYKSGEASAYEDGLYDGEGYYYSTKLITSGIVYNTAVKAPTSWKDLADPAVKNQIAMPSPLYSGAALIHLSTLTENKDLGWDYYQALAANEARAKGGNGGTFKAVASGEKPYGVVVDFLAIRGKADGSPVDFVFPSEGVTYVTEPVAIMKDAKNVDAAHKFVDFLLSEKGQELVLDMGYIPARNDMALPAGFPVRSEIKLMDFNPAIALEQAEANKQKFADMFGAE